MRRPGFVVLAAGLMASAAVVAAEPRLPDLGERIKAFQAEQEAQGGGKLGPSGRQALDRAMGEIREALPDPGLEVGAWAPDFTLPNAFGEEVSLADQLAQGPVILTFYRGAWCPYCNLELKALQESLPAFREHGARVLAVSPQKPGESLDLADYNGDGRYVLPVPGTFVIDREGVVRAAFARVDYKKRMEPAAILEALRKLPEE